MKGNKSSLALFIGNRGFFPASLLEAARREMAEVIENLGHEVLMLDAAATRYGAVETRQEGQLFANFLRQNKGRYDGVILCLPNFGDETGAITALKEADVPILIQAYPDDLDKMAPEKRRDAFCGKLAVMDMFCQCGLRFTALRPHTVHPRNPRFADNIDYFDRLCRVVRGMRSMVVGAIGARTTAFKTVRIDEVALQRHGITTETLDLADILARVTALSPSDEKVRSKAKRLKEYTSWMGVPDAAFDTLTKLGVVLDDVIEEYALDACAIRCWIEMQRQLKVSPCVLLSEMNDRGIAAACEVDVGNAVTMRALSVASGSVAACLDWNNNYGDEEDKCILFHCGPVPQTMMKTKGHVTDHAILINSMGRGCGYGCNIGQIAPTAFTFGGLLTETGALKYYLGQGQFTEDSVPADFFGCAGVAQIEDLQGVLQTLGYLGHRHHVSITPGRFMEPIREAFEKYLGYEVTAV